jgi:ubiquinone/menaquinone biosynthesis C-methylase UbiE
MFEGLDERHSQFKEQAQWTKSIRAYLIERSQLLPDDKCLEVGCGTGALLAEWEHFINPAVGIDIDIPSLQYASSKVRAALSGADAHTLPFPTNSFDCIFSHYFFLWVKHPQMVLEEIHRCLKSGGSILIFAEPDYGGRIDYPMSLSSIKDMQIKALTNHGADPLIGRKMKQILKDTGFCKISGGILGSEWSEDTPNSSIDIQNILFDITNIRDEDIDTSSILEIDKKARADGTRISFVPTFFFSAQKP